jgi:glycosyltransferase involved in cell wall biosynthesis
MQPAISFVVTAREEPRGMLEATLDGLLGTSTGYDREIILIDDASSEAIAVERPYLRVVRSPCSKGVAQSRRLGASLASGEILVFTDAHISFAPDWLEHMLAYVDSGAMLCAAWWNYELTRPVCWGADFVWCSERDYAAGRSPGFALKHRTRFPGEGAVEVPMALGACYMVLRESYEAAGGFSPHFRIWGKSEQDISARMWISGMGVKCVTGAHAGHFSRSRFPYPVRWHDIEFNQAAMIRTTFEPRVSERMEELMSPLPDDVREFLAAVDFKPWRDAIQSRRKMADAEFFQRFVQNAPEL